jgi:hypothetical protein
VLTRKAAGGADTAPTEKVELFRLTEDPNETTDLAARLPDKVTALRARLEQMAAADRDSVVRD